MSKNFIITKEDRTIQSAQFNGQDCILRCFETKEQLKMYKTLAEISSDYIPQIVNIEETKNGFNIWEEYIDGLTLDIYLQEKGCLSEKEIYNIALQLSYALDAIHSAQIIHRDIKPSNIMITCSGKIVLIDFHASRLYSDETKNKDTRLLGTEGYAAPEQFGFSQTDFRTDYYGLGASLYELRSGSTPDGKFNYKGKLRGPVEKCLSFNPDDRYSNGKDLRTALTFALYKKYIYSLIAVIVLIIAIFVIPLIGNSEHEEVIENINNADSIYNETINNVGGIYKVDDTYEDLPTDWSANYTERIYAGQPIDVYDLLPREIALYTVPLNLDGFKALINNNRLTTSIEDALGKEKDNILDHYVNSAYYFSYDIINGIYFAEGPFFAWEITKGGTVHFAYTKVNRGIGKGKIWEYTNNTSQECGEEMLNWRILAENELDTMKDLNDIMNSIAEE